MTSLAYTTDDPWLPPGDGVREDQPRIYFKASLVEGPGDRRKSHQ